jgi:hypothetical protein
MKALRWSGKLILRLAGGLMFLWAFGALYFDGPARWLAVAQALSILAVLIFVKRRAIKLRIFNVWFIIVLGWWLTLEPWSEANWPPDVARLASADIDGDVVTLHNVRNVDYRSETDYTVNWGTRRVEISKITGIDMAISKLGSPWMAHPIISFQIADAPPLCFSIEARKRKGERFSAIGSLYRRFTLIFVVAEERDVIGARTNHREREDVYLYRTTLSAEDSRERFREYLVSVNALNRAPRWYNVITTNCTTCVRYQHPIAGRLPWDWRMLVNGKADEMMYERKAIVTAGLPFAELNRCSFINDIAREAGDGPDFPTRIRVGVPGM